VKRWTPLFLFIFIQNLNINIFLIFQTFLIKFSRRISVDAFAQWFHFYFSMCQTIVFSFSITKFRKNFSQESTKTKVGKKKSRSNVDNKEMKNNTLTQILLEN